MNGTVWFSEPGVEGFAVSTETEISQMFLKLPFYPGSFKYLEMGNIHIVGCSVAVGVFIMLTPSTVLLFIILGFI